MRAADPDAMVVAPCGYDLARCLEELPLLQAKPGWADLARSRCRPRLFADGNAYFNRPGPRLADTAESWPRFCTPTFPPTAMKGPRRRRCRSVRAKLAATALTPSAVAAGCSARPRGAAAKSSQPRPPGATHRSYMPHVRGVPPPRCCPRRMFGTCQVNLGHGQIEAPLGRGDLGKHRLSPPPSVRARPTRPRLPAQGLDLPDRWTSPHDHSFSRRRTLARPRPARW